MKNLMPHINTLVRSASTVREEFAFDTLTTILEVLASTSDGTISYKVLGKKTGIFSGSTQMSDLMARRMKEDHAEEKPLLCSLIVSKTTGLPSQGFFSEAKRLGYVWTDDETFAREQADRCRKCYSTGEYVAPKMKWVLSSKSIAAAKAREVEEAASCE